MVNSLGDPAFILFGLYLDDLFNVTGITGDFSPLRDALGSVLALTDLSGNVAGTYTYDPYGNTTIPGEDPAQFQYLGRENDNDDAMANPNGIYYLRNRYYSPGLGRFLSRDPSGIAGGVNLYAYASDDPTDFADPSGLGQGLDGAEPDASVYGYAGGIGSPTWPGLRPMRSQGGLNSDIMAQYHGQNGGGNADPGPLQIKRLFGRATLYDCCNPSTSTGDPFSPNKLSSAAMPRAIIPRTGLPIFVIVTDLDRPGS